ncbi:MAG: LPP20 family lipoprotein [Proteobacteria bacterium]|nr:LPP20 family lipoprotein [Pseudomonadota bacterium]
MHQNTRIHIVVGIILLAIIGCSNMQTSDRRFSTPDGAVIPPAVIGETSAEVSDVRLGHSSPARAVVTLHAVGRGIAPEDAINKGQAILLGECAARANGYVKLAEKIHGVYVDSYRQMGRGVVDIEIVYQETQAWLRGAEVLEYKQIENGIFEAYMKVRIIVNQDHPLFQSGT